MSSQQDAVDAGVKKTLVSTSI